MTLADLTWHQASSGVYQGVDGCRGGWIVATFTNGTVELTFSRDLSPLLLRDTARLLIDMPIGLPSRQRRSCDREGRVLLGHRRSTLFPVATREALYAPSYIECCEINAKLQGCRVSKQLWNIASRIRELDQMLQERGNIREMIAEGHPELAFMSINPDQRTLSPKGTPEGVQERCSLINKLISGDITEKCASLLRDHRREATIVDCLDATALVLMLAQGGGGISFIGDGARDEVGLPMRIAAKVRDKR